MRYPQDIIDEVRAHNDIVDVIGGYVALRSRGGNYFGLCPFHNEKTPSFSVSSDKQIYYCFGCGAGGNVISFIMQIENYDFLDALKFLADRVNFTLPVPQQSEAAKEKLRKRDILREINKVAARFYYDVLNSDSPESAAANKYLDDRGMDRRIRVRFGIGLAPDNWDDLIKNLEKHGFNLSDMVESGLVKSNPEKGRHYDRFRGRLMFPIMDIDGHVAGFGGRIMDQAEKKAKYLNSPESLIFDKSRQLYGIHAARKVRAREIILTEGYMDVLSLHQAGYPQTVGILGTSLTPAHARMLKRINCDTAILLFDRDKAGTEAVLRAIPILLEAGLKVKCLQVSEDVKDPDEYIQKHGPARFGLLLQEARSHAAYRIKQLTQKYDLTNTDKRIEFTQQAASVLAEIDNAIEADAYIRETAELTGITSEAILAETDKQRSKFFSKEAPPIDRVGLRHNLRGKKAERGLLEARKGLLSVLLAYPEISRKMKEFLPPNEIGGKVEQKLLKLAYKNGEKDIVAVPADIVAQFETLDEQKQVAELLKDGFDYDSKDALEKAVNEMWRIVKRAWLGSQFEQKSDEIDPNAINTHIEAKRKLEKQYITIVNG